MLVELNITGINANRMSIEFVEFLSHIKTGEIKLKKIIFNTKNIDEIGCIEEAKGDYFYMKAYGESTSLVIDKESYNKILKNIENIQELYSKIMKKIK